MDTKSKALGALLVAGLLLLAASSSRAVTLTLQQGASGYTGYTDTTVRNEPANVNSNFNNTTNGLFFGVTLTPSTLHGLLSFDLSAIPTGSTINSVTLTLVTLKNDGSSNPFAYQIDLTSLGTHFTDTTATWNNYNGTNAWPTAGGDIGSTLSSLNLNPQTVAAGTVNTFASTANFITAAQNAVNGTHTFDLALKLDSETIDFRKVYFFYDSAGGLNAPLLTIDYTAVPEPSAIVLSLLGLGSVLAVRFRRLPALA